MFFFFFSSRRRHTRWPRDWSSDVCSSDLDAAVVRRMGLARDQVLVELLLVGPQDLAGGAIERIDLVIRARIVEYTVYGQREALQAAVGTRGHVRPGLLPLAD